VRAVDVNVTAAGTSFVAETFAGSHTFQLKLIGKFNIYNALAAITAGLVEGISLDQMAHTLASIPGVNGRFEPVDAGQPYLVVVDYAHTPDSLENVIRTIQQFVTGNIITVFGCGGDRDRTKRPIMGKIAAEMSDITLVTSDNPRTEHPTAIIGEIVAGIGPELQDSSRLLVIEDRQIAIKKAIEIAQPHDVVLIAGKGHETYQEIDGVRHEFDDREIAKLAIRGMLN
jgi:UDP-N-acetylmuramoyl-L-alanyl-D-glutamate--2,6-diaminopimelate ligase